MAENDPIQDRIQVAVLDDVGYARVLGRGSFKVSASLKEYGGMLLNADIHRLVMDLRDCVGMDSTFMGVLAGLCNRFRRTGEDARIVMINTSDKIKRLMATLGLDRLVEISDEEGLREAPSAEKAKLEDLEPKAQTPLESAENMLEAHENLVGMHKDNELRFQDVLDYLREDIQRQQRS